ncbi:MAG TPA: rRNA adenine N(6)-methyltransferase family protein, partial [Solirubrobacteraceae bacterium]|nr:rRNA adenine N(6)-methyltransferase family protein [Solirubrobacteraceae bacterium]
GALTAAAAARGARVVAVELDHAWVDVLASRAAGWGDVEVVAGDALAVPLPAEPFYVVSSAPYGIGTRLVRRLLSDAHGLVRAALVMQRETARRLAGRPSSGRFAALWAPWFELRVARRIPPGAFRPVPAVDSAVLTLAPRATPLLSPAAFGDYDAFLAIVFGGGGRTVADRLARRCGRRGAQRVLAAAGVAAGATPSRVPPEHYARLFAAYRAKGPSETRRSVRPSPGVPTSWTGL